MGNQFKSGFLYILGRLAVIGLMIFVAFKVAVFTAGLVAVVALGLLWFLLPTVILPVALIIAIVALILDFSWDLFVLLLVILLLIFLNNRFLEARRF